MLQKKKWFIYLQDHHEGPLSVDEIRQHMETGRVSNGNYVWAEGMPDWKLMTEIIDFSSLTQPKAPLFHTQSLDRPSRQSGTVTPVSIHRTDSEVTGDMEFSEVKNEVKKIRDIGTTPTTSKPQKKHIKIGMILVVVLFILGGSLIYFPQEQHLLELSRVLQSQLSPLIDQIRPSLWQLSEKFSFLSGLISPIPHLPDVKEDEFTLLQTAAQAPLDQAGGQIAIALAQTQLQMPSFYLASNLPDGTLFQIHCVGHPETLLNQLSFTASHTLKLNQKLVKTAPFQTPSGAAIPAGYYTVYLVLNDSQPATTKKWESNLPRLQNTLLPPLLKDLPHSTQILLQKKYFLGGIEDANYSTQLKIYHEKLQAKATFEIDEITQLTSTLDSQLKSTQTKFSLLLKGKSLSKKKSLWNDFNTEWDQLANQLKLMYSQWTPEVLKEKYYYGNLYLQVMHTSDAINRVHELHGMYFSQPQQDQLADNVELKAALTAAQDALTTLQSKVAQLKARPASATGMPPQEGS